MCVKNCDVMVLYCLVMYCSCIYIYIFYLFLYLHIYLYIRTMYVYTLESTRRHIGRKHSKVSGIQLLQRTAKASSQCEPGTQVLAGGRSRIGGVNGHSG